MKTKRIQSALTLFGALSIPIAATVSCGSKALTLDPAKKDSVVMIVGSIGHKDKGFNQGGYDGAQEAIKQISGLKHYSEIKTKANGIPQSKEAVKSAIAAGGYIILGVGYQYSTFMNTQDYAGAYPKREFIAIDNAVAGTLKTNVTAIVFRAELAAFLAGVATGIYLAKNYDTYSGNGGLKVGAFGGGKYPSVQNMLAGYIQGLAYYNDKLAKNNDHKVKFIGWNEEENGFTRSFAPNPASVAKADVLINKKADVVFPVAGGQVSSMVDAIKKASANTKIVGVDSDQSKVFGTDGTHFITSVLKDTKVAAREAIKAIYGVTGALIEKGKNNIAGLDGGFVGLAPGDFDGDNFKGIALAGAIKNNGGIDTSAEVKVYAQLTTSANTIYQYAKNNIDTNWDKATVAFGANGDATPTLSTYTN